MSVWGTFGLLFRAFGLSLDMLTSKRPNSSWAD